MIGICHFHRRRKGTVSYTHLDVYKRQIMDHQHADFRGNSGVRFVCRLKRGAPKGAPPSHKRPQCGRFFASARVHLFGSLVTLQVVRTHER